MGWMMTVFARREARRISVRALSTDTAGAVILGGGRQPFCGGGQLMMNLLCHGVDRHRHRHRGRRRCVGGGTSDREE